MSQECGFASWSTEKGVSGALDCIVECKEKGVSGTWDCIVEYKDKVS